MRSVDDVGATASYWVVVLHGVHAAHTRKLGSEGGMPVTSPDTSKKPTGHPTMAVLTTQRFVSHGDAAVVAGSAPTTMHVPKSERLRQRRPITPVPDAIVQPNESHV